MDPSVEADIMRLNTNSVVHGALLLALFETHPQKTAVIEVFSSYAKTLGDLLWQRPDLPAVASSETEEAFREMIGTLTRIAHRHDQ